MRNSVHLGKVRVQFFKLNSIGSILVDDVENGLKLLIGKIFTELGYHVFPFFKGHLATLILIKRVENLVQRNSLLSNDLFDFLETKTDLFLCFLRNSAETLNFLPLEDRHMSISRVQADLMLGHLILNFLD